ncbi:MAG: hypothetical protein V7772_07865 [Pseudomonas profundi]|uniref:hypothetical protein n=1 Tax=Pseudomonas profundi TaxID=1981513 RepID=UPI003001C6A8
MSNLPSCAALNQALFLADLMHTCCVENDCHDEYERIAAGVFERLQQGQPLEPALRDELGEWFDVEMASRVDLNPILNRINGQ